MTVPFQNNTRGKSLKCIFKVTKYKLHIMIHQKKVKSGVLDRLSITKVTPPMNIHTEFGESYTSSGTEASTKHAYTLYTYKRLHLNCLPRNYTSECRPNFAISVG